jgi:hypothetical protein
VEIGDFCTIGMNVLLTTSHQEPGPSTAAPVRSMAARRRRRSSDLSTDPQPRLRLWAARRLRRPRFRVRRWPEAHYYPANGADVAQLVERRLPKPKVAGSRPVVRFQKGL